MLSDLSGCERTFDHHGSTFLMNIAHNDGEVSLGSSSPLIYLPSRVAIVLSVPTISTSTCPRAFAMATFFHGYRVLPHPAVCLVVRRTSSITVA